ncbi:site-specific integrase [Flagellimonas hymeniacidonis]|nr:site-specific integrase [Flagellimonas hymeniacidonis]
MNILFYPKKKGAKNTEMVPIYARITINGRRSEFSIGRKVQLRRWDSQSGKLRGTALEISNFNRFLESVKNKCFEIYENYLKEGERVSASIIKNAYLGKSKKVYGTLEVFKNHNDEMQSLLGKDYSRGTLQRYQAAYNHLQSYIRYSLRTGDTPIHRVDHKFITGFEYFLKTKQKLGHNTTIKYVVNFKKIIRIAYANEWIKRDPFFYWKASWKNKNRECLTESELSLLAEEHFENKRLDRVRDIFLFCCYTGLAYVDVKKLKKDNIVIGIDGKRWIKTYRNKTKTLSSIPLLSIAEIILKKYSHHSTVHPYGNLLPVPTNQKTNEYLKEIADVCGIKKNLTTHLARHTFATTVTLSNGVPIESVSKMLGHQSLKTTQIYAKVLDRKIADDMAALREKMGKVNYYDKIVEV